MDERHDIRLYADGVQPVQAFAWRVMLSFSIACIFLYNSQQNIALS